MLALAAGLDGDDRGEVVRFGVVGCGCVQGAAELEDEDRLFFGFLAFADLQLFELHGFDGDERRRWRWRGGGDDLRGGLRGGGCGLRQTDVACRDADEAVCVAGLAGEGR